MNHHTLLHGPTTFVPTKKEITSHYLPSIRPQLPNIFCRQNIISVRHPLEVPERLPSCDAPWILIIPIDIHHNLTETRDALLSDPRTLSQT